MIQQVWRRGQRERKVALHNSSLQNSCHQQQPYDGEEEPMMRFSFLQNHWRGGPGEQLASLITEQMKDTTFNEVNYDDEEVQHLRAQLVGTRKQLESTRQELEKCIVSTGNRAEIDMRAPRSNHMHHWDEAQTAMWLEEIGFPKYAASAKSHGGYNG